jgi:hypothetical protein
VEIRRWTSEISEALQTADEWSQRNGKDVVVNSIDDGIHGNPSFHGWSVAIDFDDETDDHADLQSLYAWLNYRLSSGWDVIDKGDHVHTEYDPKHRGGAKPWGG